MRSFNEPIHINRQFLLTKETDRTLKRLLDLCSDACGLDLKHSELFRAVLLALAHAMPELQREVESIGRLRRPKNDRQNLHLQAQLERRIAAALVAGLRAAGTLLP